MNNVTLWQDQCARSLAATLNANELRGDVRFYMALGTGKSEHDANRAALCAAALVKRLRLDGKLARRD